MERNLGPPWEVPDEATIEDRAGAGVSAGPTRVLAAVVGAVVLLAGAAAVLATTRDAPAYDRDTPQGAVQAYVAAVIDGDHRAAAALLADDSSCDAVDLDEQSYGYEDSRVVLRETRIDGDEAEVVVGVALSSTGDLFAGPERFERHTFRLVGGAGDWRLTGVPWPMFECGMRGTR